MQSYGILYVHLMITPVHLEPNATPKVAKRVREYEPNRRQHYHPPTHRQLQEKTRRRIWIELELEVQTVELPMVPRWT